MRSASSPIRLGPTLRDLESKRLSGVLRILRDGDERKLYFREGRIVAASDRPVDDPAAIREELFEVFSWAEVELRFEAGVAPPSGGPSLELRPTELVLEALRRAVVEDAPEEPATLDDLESIVQWPEGDDFPDATLSMNESTLLDVLRGSPERELPVGKLLELSPLSRRETLKSLSVLIAAGMLEWTNSRSEDLSATRADGAWSPASWPGLSFPATLGRFQIEGVLGRGSMGAVLLATDPAIDRIVAIKLIGSAVHWTASEQEKHRERFYREASAAGRLHHPGIVKVFDVDHTGDGIPFIVMEHIEGRTLREVLDEERLPPPRVIGIAIELLDALSYAHAEGIVHRDIKPSNILITHDFRPKIMDFGIAHVVGSELTAGDDILGSPYYMAPEQLSKKAIDQRTDLFSTAVVLFEMLTGRPPFDGDSFAAVAQAILTEGPDRIDELPSGLGRILKRGLAKDPGDRYQTAAELREELARILALPARVDETRSRPHVRRDRWLAVAMALVLGAFFVLRLALPPQAPVARRAGSLPAGSTEAQENSPPDASNLDIARDSADSGAKEETPSRSKPGPTVTPSPSPPPRPAPSARPAPKEISERPAAPRPTPEPEPEPVPGEAELFYAARLALEQGNLEESKATLDALLARDPSFAGAAELLVEVTDEIWKQTRLPLVIPARHNHRLGGCEGELTLAVLGVRYRSPEHDWAFGFDAIRVLERRDDRTLQLETYEKDLFGLGKNKRYKFELDEPLDGQDWTRYERLLR